MGVLSFISEMQRNNLAQKLAEQEKQNRLAEIAAQGQNQLAVLERANKLAEQQRKEQEVERQHTSALNQSQYLDSRIQNLIDSGLSPMEAGAQANREVNSMQTEPAYVPTSSAMVKNAFNKGLLGSAESLGKASSIADVMGAKAREAGSFNDYNTAIERQGTLPLAAVAKDRAEMAASKNLETSAMAANPGINRLVPAQQQAQEAEALSQAAKANQEAKVFPLLSASDEAMARNRANQASTAGSLLSTTSGGLFTPGVGNNLLGNYMVPKEVLQTISQALLNAATNKASVVPTPATLPVRTPTNQPINLKNLGITLPME